MYHQKKAQKWMALVLCAAMLSAALLPVKAKAAEITELSVSIPAEQSEPPDISTGNTIPDEIHEGFDVDEVIGTGEAGLADTPATPEEDTIPHPVAGDSSATETEPDQIQAEVSYQNDGGVWTEGTLLEAVEAITGVGTIKLNQDITLNSGAYDIPALTLSGDQDITLLGEGHTITSENGSLSVTENAGLSLGQAGYSGELTIKTTDNITRETIMLQVTDHAKLEMYDGVTLGPTQRNYAVKLQQSGTFTMHGGRVSKCDCYSPIAITDVASFYLEGGIIETCSGIAGGAVGLLPNSPTQLDGRALFRMSGGIIRNCEGYFNGGGAIYVETRNAAELDVCGGLIQNCVAVPGASWSVAAGYGRGGGIGIWLRDNNSKISISNVTIEGCSAYAGGGISVRNKEETQGNVTFGENLRIENCKAEYMGGGIISALDFHGVNFEDGVTILGNSAQYGGGLYLTESQCDISGCVIGDNTAGQAGDDLYLYHSDLASFTLPDNFGGLSLTDCGHKINGWYPDLQENRWSCCGDEEWTGDGPLSGTISNDPDNGQYAIALKAAHGTLPPEPVVVRPADITVYSGGEGYLGVVDSAGNSGDAVAENGIPQPGYYITLPEKLANQLTNPLSDNLTFYYNDGNGTTRQWDVSLYGTAEHSSGGQSGEHGTVYKLQPHSQEQSPVRIQITDPDTGNYVLSDDFVPTAFQEYEEYEMTIYAGALNAGYVTAKLTVGDETHTLPVDIEPGKLVVRRFQDQTVYAIANSEADMASANITALVPADADYFINRGNVQLTAPQDARLLVDSVSQGDALVAYLRTLDSGTASSENLVYVPRYLDLVDTTNGNVYLTLEKDTPNTIYWPAPQDYAENGQVRIFHFPALDRSRSESLDTLLSQQPPQQSTPEVVTVGGNRYFKFSPEALATFVLMYEKTPNTVSGDDSGDSSGNSASGGSVTATPRHPLTVESGSGSGCYAAGTQTTITAQPAPDGQEFERWITLDGGTFEDAYSPSTTFHMPNHAVTVTALYRNIDAQIGEDDGSEGSADPQQPTTPEPFLEQEQPGHNEEPSLHVEFEETLQAGVSSSALDDVPQTGDVSHLELWVTCMILSLLGLTGLLVLRKKSSV